MKTPAAAPRTWAPEVRGALVGASEDARRCPPYLGPHPPPRVFGPAHTPARLVSPMVKVQGALLAAMESGFWAGWATLEDEAPFRRALSTSVPVEFAPEFGRGHLPRGWENPPPGRYPLAYWRERL